MTTKKYLIITVTALLACCAVIFFMRHQPAGKVYLKVVPFQTANGWGYNILADNKIYIHQDYIPAVSGKHGFKTREDALRVGKRVVEKIGTNQSPAITPKDLEDLGILKK